MIIAEICSGVDGEKGESPFAKMASPHFHLPIDREILR
jgi:hypothetical protein